MGVLTLLVPLLGLVVFAAAAVGWGIDSRDADAPGRGSSDARTHG